MSITVAIQTDWRIFDNVETVSITNQAGTTTSGKTALKEGLQQVSTDQANVSLQVIRTTWHMFVSDLGSVKPEEHGYITDANNLKHYINEEPELVSWDTRWKIKTTAQAAAVLAVSLS